MQAALVAGTIAGTLLFVYQYLVVVPRIVAAEAYESRERGRWGGSGPHQHSEWKPDEGLERSFFTAASTILTGIGFAALLLSTVTLCGFELDVRRGLLWGLAGFVCFAVAPALGPAAGAAWRPRIRRSRAPALVGHDRCRYRGRPLPDLRDAVAGGSPESPAGCCSCCLTRSARRRRSDQRSFPHTWCARFALASIAGNGLFWLVLGAAAGFLSRRTRSAS